MKKAIVRPYQSTDRSDVIALWEHVFADDPAWNKPADVINTKLTVQPELFLVATIDDELIGTTLAGFDGVRGWLHHVATHPDYQRTGVAEQLVWAAEAGLTELGCRKLNLQVRSTNAKVIGFYERLGFTIEERVSLGKLL